MSLYVAKNYANGDIGDISKIERKYVNRASYVSRATKCLSFSAWCNVAAATAAIATTRESLQWTRVLRGVYYNCGICVLQFCHGALCNSPCKLRYTSEIWIIIFFFCIAPLLPCFENIHSATSSRTLSIIDRLSISTSNFRFVISVAGVASTTISNRWLNCNLLYLWESRLSFPLGNYSVLCLFT